MKLIKSLFAMLCFAIIAGALSHLGGTGHAITAGLVVFSFGVDKIVKKVGKAVFTSNHYGAVIRKLVKPVNPKSSAQTIQRNLLKTTSQAWRGLSQAQILGWNNLALLISHTNRVGTKGTLTGEALFIRCNLNAQVNGGAALTAAPSIAANDVPALAGVTINISSGVISMAFTPGVVATNIVEVRSSGIVSAGRTYNSKFKSFFTFPSSHTSPETLTSSWTGIFGTAPSAGNVVFFEYRVVDNTTGFSTLYTRVRIVAS